MVKLELLLKMMLNKREILFIYFIYLCACCHGKCISGLFFAALSGVVLARPLGFENVLASLQY